MGGQLSFHKSPSGQIIFVKIRGDFDLNCARKLQQTLPKLPRDIPDYVVNLEGCDHLSLAGVGALLLMSDDTHLSPEHMRMVNIPMALLATVENAQLEKHFQLLAHSN